MAEQDRRKRPIATYFLLAFTAFMMIYVSLLPPSEVESLYGAYALSTLQLFKGVGVVGLLTYMFLHGSWLHFIVNAIALWGAGGIVEREIGSARYLLVYLASGMAAGLVHCFLHPSSGALLIGSSGAIFGVIAVLFLLMPFKITFALIVPLPSVLVGIMLVAVAFSAVWLSTDTVVANDVHLSGFIFGSLCAFAIDRMRALKGLIIGVAVFAVLYYLGIRFEVISPVGGLKI